MDLSTLNLFSSASAWQQPVASNAKATQISTEEQKARPSESNAQVSEEKDTETSASSETTGPTRPDGTPLAPEEIQHLEQLKQTDREVRQHEMAHQTVGGPYTGGASYEYEVGPDGKRYAVAGEVPIDYGPVPGNPTATIEKMQTVIAAALAPAEPSSKDIQVAAQARQYLLEAKLEAAREQSEMNAARSAGEATTEDVAAAPNEQAA
ncbi:putative metalloprotease CJM1_0395 family protein [Halomonas sp. GT]|uniref:putative metalloprotease CJM1_0395 family protein n=1 Tax=Halomonas sp. GT TaxID=1971364 RepID=UPI0009F27BE5|nr:putative metalloprotease CJM1_0395 family protein [Halomonas sp. GT]